ncbi:endolytic transglycosylase MltG [Streptomyces sp. NPDC059740]|uniref:endolytic transglycosylase MltG n=1 Tax=Streptomyces sp. NPDC059740 TaxID=3346926 RepID=UPI003661D8BA
MTEYGRGYGHEPWHPEDPLYGDSGNYGGQGVPRAPSHQQHPQAGHQADPYGPPADGTAQPGQGYPGQDHLGQGTYYGQGWGGDPHGTGELPMDPGGWQGHPSYPAQPAHPGGHHPGPGYQDPGYAYDPYAAERPAEPYGADPYGPGHDAYHPGADAYAAGPDAYGRHPQAAGPETAQFPHVPQQDGPHGGWDGAPGHGQWQGGEDGHGQWADPDGDPHGWATDTGEHVPGPRRGTPAATPGDAFFDDGTEGHAAFGDHDPEPADPDEDEDGDGGRRGRRGGGRPKRRSGLACLTMSAVLVAGVGVVGWFGYDFYQTHFAPPPDYEGSGSGSTQVEIPDGASTGDMGRVLEKAGVVKSSQAFVAAATDNPKGNTIQPGAYNMHKRMSGAAAVSLMLNPTSRNGLTVPEGTRNAGIYKLIDAKLKVKPGTTASVAKEDADKLGLPSWAEPGPDVMDPLEGFLWPSTYSVGDHATPESVLKDMVSRAKASYTRYDLAGQASKLGLDSPRDLVTVASLVQAEGKTDEDFRKMAEVVYNRLKPTNTDTNQKLQFDSTYNYLKGQSNIDISEREINSDQNPYNTYTHRGLPPGPIDNPGQEALKATLAPTHDGWLYFVATDGMNKTEFARTHSEFLRLKEKFDDSSGH